MSDIANLRDQIDECDAEFVKQLVNRLTVVRKIGSLKKLQSSSVVDIDREIEITEKVEKMAGELTDDASIIKSVEKVFLAIITVSRRLQ